MNKTRNKELKRSARRSLLGHYGTVIGALIFSQLVVDVINIPFNQMAQQGLAYAVYPRVILGLVGTLVISLLTYLFKCGLAYLHLQIARGQKARFSDFFYVFKNRPDRYLGYAVILMVITIICGIPDILLLIFLYVNAIGNGIGMLYALLCALSIAGLIVSITLSLALALTPYILLDNPSMRVPAALHLSMQLMRGNKWRLFQLVLSFLGWILFSLLSFGLGLLWVLPYKTQTVTWFYLGFITDEP